MKSLLQTRWGYAGGYLVTVNDDGKIPLNSKVIMTVPSDLPRELGPAIASVPEFIAALQKVLKMYEVGGGFQDPHAQQVRQEVVELLATVHNALEAK